MTKLQTENLAHTEAAVQAARHRLEKADATLKEKNSSLDYALKQHKEAASEREESAVALSVARTRFFHVVEEIVPLPIGPAINPPMGGSIDGCGRRC